MEFIYASELKKCYQVYAHFYYLTISKQKWLCRSVADIIENSADTTLQAEDLNAVPNAVVVMMNPGAARPVVNSTDPSLAIMNLSRQRLFDASHLRPKLEVCADNAQYQLMRLMKLKQWRHLRIINLSDLCEGSSQDFAKLYGDVGQYDDSHPESLMHNKRIRELDFYLDNVFKIILAWGRQPVLEGAARDFLNRYDTGVGLARDYPWYRFASPYRKDQKLSWLEQIESVL